MSKGLAIAGFILSFIGVLTFILNLYSLAWLGLVTTIIGFIINLAALIMRLDGKKYAIFGIFLNLVFVFIAYIMPIYLG